jgi:hypothetical protein
MAVFIFRHPLPLTIRDFENLLGAMRPLDLFPLSMRHNTFSTKSL